MSGCQNYDPFLGTLNIRCRIRIGIQEGTIIFDNHRFINQTLTLDNIIVSIFLSIIPIQSPYFLTTTHITEPSTILQLQACVLCTTNSPFLRSPEGPKGCKALLRYVGVCQNIAYYICCIYSLVETHISPGSARPSVR